MKKTPSQKKAELINKLEKKIKQIEDTLFFANEFGEIPGDLAEIKKYLKALKKLVIE